MPTYQYPGVYVEETDTGNKPIEGVSTSIVGFLGIAERGPVTPTFITSNTDYDRIFGQPKLDALGNPLGYLSYAVEGFFQNQGQQCWVARVASNSAAAASFSSAAMGITAIGPGLWGSQIGFLVTPSIVPKSTLFSLTFFYWSDPAAAAAAKALSAADVANGKAGATADLIETFDNLSANKNASTYYVAAINGVSNLVTVTQKTTAAPASTTTVTFLTGGSDGAALVPIDFQGNAKDPLNPTALLGLAAIDDISLLCCPDEFNQSSGVVADLLNTQCLTLLDRFAILQSARTDTDPSKVTVPTQVQGSQYCAFYYPWLNVIDPTTGIKTLIPPGGHVAGIYARSDSNRSVAKDPANEIISGIDSLQLQMTNQMQGPLNVQGVNALRFFQNRGNLVWGGRTTSSDPDWQYINVRRLFIFIEKSIQQGTQWVVFEPNDQTTWARVRQSVSDFLTGLWLDDMLQGAKKEQAFFVRCDQTTMTPADIESGRLIMIIGIAPVYPAEFVIFRIGQWDGGSSVTET